MCQTFNTNKAGSIFLWNVSMQLHEYTVPKPRTHNLNKHHHENLEAYILIYVQQLYGSPGTTTKYSTSHHTSKLAFWRVICWTHSLKINKNSGLSCDLWNLPYWITKYYTNNSVTRHHIANLYYSLVTTILTSTVPRTQTEFCNF